MLATLNYVLIKFLFENSKNEIPQKLPISVDCGPLGCNLLSLGVPNVSEARAV